MQTAGKPRWPGRLCLKVASHPDAWHREAYFGQLLERERRAISIYESFACVERIGGRTWLLYCLISELAEHRDLYNYLESTRKPWSEARARREIIGLLRVLILLHQAGAVHRDLTPSNVFVTAGRFLKLGDFGIALHRLGLRAVPANAFAPWFAPTEVNQQGLGAWRPADDVYQAGQIFGSLLSGRADSRLTPKDVKALLCSPEAKAVIQRCISTRRKRFQDASAMLRAMERIDDRRARETIRSVRGKTVVFTGRLSIERREASARVQRFGGVSAPRVDARTDIVVVGEKALAWKADTKGQKLLDLDREIELGHDIAVWDERQFFRAVGLICRASR
jgi:serine/threonine-protein kinase